MNEPPLYDVIYPIFAFTMVIVIPSCVALWVIFKTLTEKDRCEDEK